MIRNSAAEHYIGLMCGTSADAIDAVLVQATAQHIDVVATLSYPLEVKIQQAVLSLNESPAISLKDLLALDTAIAAAHANAVESLLKHSATHATDIRAIGFHGQTVYHAPEHQNTLQLGNAQQLSTRTGIEVIGDLRRADMAAGGQGAPLAPALHETLFRTEKHSTAVVNIGGIANISLLPKYMEEPIRGFDTGPGNCLLDAWLQHQFDQKHDANGDIARSGRVDLELLAACENDAFFGCAPPKSTGRDHFNLHWLQGHLQNRETSAHDVATTLTELTARSIVHAIQHNQPQTQKLLVCGGGTHNGYLMSRLQALSTTFDVASTAEVGTSPDDIEGVLVAWLAMRYCRGLPGNIPSVTGAFKAVRLGASYLP